MSILSVAWDEFKILTHYVDNYNCEMSGEDTRQEGGVAQIQRKVIILIYSSPLVSKKSGVRKLQTANGHFIL